MSDRDIRAAQARLEREQTREAREAFNAVWLRGGRRDPRHDPRAGDVLQHRYHRVTVVHVSGGFVEVELARASLAGVVARGTRTDNRIVTAHAWPHESFVRDARVVVIDTTAGSVASEPPPTEPPTPVRWRPALASPPPSLTSRVPPPRRPRPPEPKPWPKRRRAPVDENPEH